MTPEDSDIAEGIVQDKLPEHIPPAKTEFLPWHRVRKQFIRRYQWNELTTRNVNDSWRSDLQKPSATGAQHSRMHVTQPLRCLTIPGNHLLDIRSLWGALQALDCFIRYLGFNEGQGSAEIGTDVYVANNAATSLAGVLPDSQVVKDRFESIAGNTLAYSMLKRYGPYHIVNLDLCGSMFPNTLSSVEPYYNALNRLLAYQFANQKTTWLLFITTVVEPDIVDKAWMQKLCEPTRQNNAHADFSGKLEQLFPSAVVEEDDQKKNVKFESIAGEDLVRLFGMALGKWLLRLGQTASPKWTIGMRRSFQYSINKEKGAVMLSLAFEMSPNIAPPVDETGMSTLPVKPKKFPSELECAMKLAESVANIGDVDSKLASDAAMKAALLEESADLLAAAGFDREAYIKWVHDGEVAA
jgi:hypothetical protein